MATWHIALFLTINNVTFLKIKNVKKNSQVTKNTGFYRWKLKKPLSPTNKQMRSLLRKITHVADHAHVVITILVRLQKEDAKLKTC